MSGLIANGQRVSLEAAVGLRSLPVGGPLAPPTQLSPAGLKAIRDRLGLVTNIDGYPEEMVAAVRHTIETILTRDVPALLDAVETPADPGCGVCASIHRVFHDLP